jgi:phospholipase C
MLENRSFDCMLGRLYPAGPDYDGLTLNESNTYGMTYGVWNDPTMSAATACIPDPDPGEAFIDMNMQLFGQQQRPPGAAPTMCGFASNYGTQPAKEGWRDPGAVMHYFTPDQVPVLSTLAKAFGVCDRWHASAPCQTWPNRFFAHTGTSLGYVDNNTFRIPFEAPSLFRRLEDEGKSWRVYFHDMPQSILLRDVWLYAPSHYRVFNQFLADAHTGLLPNYSFIEPRYFTDLFSNFIPNDQHPPHNVLYGEQLIAQVYNALRSSPCWKSTLFIITYDEHGGCFDHVPPPPAIPPDTLVNNAYGFTFNAYGVRVPAVIVSPYIPPGSRIRPPANANGGTPIPFDHTSIIKTVREVFSLGGALTARDEAAPSLIPALTLAAPNNDGPPSVTPGPAPGTGAAPSPSISQLLTRGSATPNGMQAALAAAATALPQQPPTTEQSLPQPATPDRPVYATVATAQAAAVASTNRFLGTPR